MFEFIKGTIHSKGMDHLVVETGGIGYRIHTSLSSIHSSGQPGETAVIYTHLHVKEDDVCLYGFSTYEELSVFQMLISVSGVGPKAALSVLSTLTPSRFGLAVAANDFKEISKSKGVGPKIAQKIILELKDKIKKNIAQFSAGGEISLPESAAFSGGLAGLEGEAVEALMVLGYGPSEAAKAVGTVTAAGGDGSGAGDLSLEDLVRLSLKQLMR